MQSIIAIDKDSKVQICIDGDYTVHNDRKKHSDLFLVIARGAMLNVLKKLSLVTISSTETEVVADRKRFPKYSWFRYF